MKHIPLLMASLLVAIPASAQVTFKLISQMEKTPRPNGSDHVQGWLPYNVSYFPMTEYYTNFNATRQPGTTASITVPLDTTLAAGTYDLWVAMATQNTNLMVRGRAGDGTVPDREYGGSPTWTLIGPVTSTVAFSEVTLTATKLRPQGLSQNIWFAGVGLMPSTWARLGPKINRWLPAEAMPPAPIETRSQGNLVPNSSFEFGLDAYGWTSGRNGNYITEPWLSNMTAEDAFDGQRSAVIGDGPGVSRYSIRTPAIFLRGDRTERSYNLSFYYRRKTGTISAMTLEWELVYSADEPGLSAQKGRAVLGLSTTWQRFSTNLVLRPDPNRVFQVAWSHINPADQVLIDAVQLEEGEAATPYRPSDTIECNVNLPRNGHLLDTDEPRFLNVQTYNHSSTFSNVVFHYEVFDWMNLRIQKGTNVFRAEPGYSVRPLPLTTTNTGTSRVLAWLEGSPSTRSELVFSTVPLDTSHGLKTNSYFGIAGPAQVSVVKSNAAWGISWQRGLSPASVVEWKVVEPSEDSFVWETMDARVAAISSSGILLASVSGTGDIPEWAKPNGVLRIDAWSNYVYQIVTRYKDRIRYWEDLNEPPWTPTEFAPILTATAGAVKAADPSAYFVALGGIARSKLATWMPQLWSLLSPTTISQIDALAVHTYPTEGDDTGIDGLADMQRWTGKPVWNTETGVWSWGDYKGDRTGGPVDTVSYAQHWEEYQFIRNVWINPTAQARNWIRCIGRGMTKYFLYDGRLSSYNLATEDTNPTWFNYDDSLNSVGSAYLWSRHLIDNATSITSPTNAVADPIAFVFDRPEGPTLAVFSRSDTNYAAAVSSGGFIVLDLMGNPIPFAPNAIPLGKKPTYWVSKTLTASQLHNLFASATITPRADTTAPSVSIDVTAHGLSSKKQLPLRFRWTAIDDTSINTDEQPSALSTRFRFNGLGAWSSWGPQRIAELQDVPGGIVYLEVQARDAAGNTSEVVAGPPFGLGFSEAKYLGPKAPGTIVIERVP